MDSEVTAPATDLVRCPAPWDQYLVDGCGNVYSQKSKVTRAQYDEIRAACATETQLAVAKRYGISQGSVSLYCLGALKNIPGEPVLIAPAPTGARYLGVTLSNPKRGVPKTTVHVHTIVALTYHGPCPEGLQVRHDNGDRFDNRPSNLLYGTAKQNAADRDRHGRTCGGEDQYNAKLNAGKVRDMRRRFAAGETKLSISRLYGVAAVTAGRAISGKSWAGV